MPHRYNVNTNGKQQRIRLAQTQRRKLEPGVYEVNPEFRSLGVMTMAETEIFAPKDLSSPETSFDKSIKVGVDEEDVTTDHESSHAEAAKRPPLAYCSFIVRNYKLAFFLTLGGHIVFALVSAGLMVSGYSLFPMKFSGVPLNLKDEDVYLRSLAWSARDEDASILKTNTSSSVVGSRTQNADVLMIFFQSDNVLTKEKLQAIQQLEIELTNNSEWPSYCKQDIDNLQAGCSKPLSLIRFFDGTLHPSFNDTTFSNIPETLFTASTILQFQAILKALLGKDAMITPLEATSSLTRTFFFTGMPLDGYDLTTEAQKDQIEKIKAFLVAEFRDQLYEMAEKGLRGMTVYFYSYQLMFYDIINQVIYDLLLAAGSFAFIFLFMLCQTGSLFLTGLSIVTIITSFIGANLIYRVLLDFRYFGIFHVLSIFIILGIGADNIFVFNDTWRATAHENYASMEDRLSSCYRRASKSMLITSLTTFTAFISNAFSPLQGVSTFGIFSAILVMVNFFSAIVFFPTCVIVYHKNWENWSWPCCRPCQNCSCVKKNERTSGQLRPNAVVRFFSGPYYHTVTHSLGRWMFIALCSAVAAAFLYYISKLKISEEGAQYYKTGNNYFEAHELHKKAFKQSLDDKNVKVMISFGLRRQDISNCHKTDDECKGRTVWDEAFDLNPKPAQMALLNFCHTLRHLQGHEKLHLERDPVTHLVNMKCFITALDEYMQTEGNRSSPSLDLALPTSETTLNPFFSQHPELYNSTIVQWDFYRHLETVKSYWLNNGYRGHLNSDYGIYSVLLGEAQDEHDTSEIIKSPDSLYGTKLKYAGIEVSTSLAPDSKSYQEGIEIHDAWEEFVTEQMQKMPPSVQGFQFTPDETWHKFKRQKALADSAFQGIGIGICLAFVVITAATCNIIIGLLATFTIILVTLTIAGSIAMFGWKISLIESINLSLVVGLAVDYIVHLSDSYHHCPDEDRKKRVKYMLDSMGLSVLSGAVSTLGAAAFMIAAQIQFFIVFGIFLFCTIGFSILYALCLFTPLLGIIGPEGHCGSLMPLVKWLIYKCRGRSKEDVDCGHCQGKGFCKSSVMDKLEESNGRPAVDHSSP